MLSISWGGLLGAIAGTVLAGLSYHVLIGALDQRMRQQASSLPPPQRDGLLRNMSLIRRVILASDLILFAGLGYWIGHMLGE